MPNDDINYALGTAETSGPGAVSTGKDPAVNAALRYKDGYRVARFVDGIGTGIKIFAVVVALIVFGLCMSAASGTFGGSQVSALFFFISFLCSITSGGIFFVLGVIVSALGQQLKATLDSAVHTSPFLDVPAKARVMSLD